MPVNCGPKGLPDRHQPALSQPRRRHLCRRLRAVQASPRVTGRYPMTAVAADLDDDGWPDIYVASDSTAAILYRNNRDGTFTDVALESGAAFSEHGNPQAGMGAGRRRLSTATAGSICSRRTSPTTSRRSIASSARGSSRTWPLPPGLACRTATSSGAPGSPTSTTTAAPTCSTSPATSIRKSSGRCRSIRTAVRASCSGTRATGAFEDVSGASGPALSGRRTRAAAPRSATSTTTATRRRSIMNMNEPPSLLRNDYRGATRWIVVALEGAASNRAAIGATVIVTAGGGRQARAVLSQSSYYSHDDLRLHFGLGRATRADAIEVRWPSGASQRVDERGAATESLNDHRSASTALKPVERVERTVLSAVTYHFRNAESCDSTSRAALTLSIAVVCAQLSRSDRSEGSPWQSFAIGPAAIAFTRVALHASSRALRGLCRRRPLAQAVYGSIGGTVTDPTGGVLPGVTVDHHQPRAQDRRLGRDQRIRAVRQGSAAAGHLRSQGRAAGLQAAVVPERRGRASTRRRRSSSRCRSARSPKRVTVTGGSPLLKTDRADVATSFDSKQITDLPVLDRNFTKFMLLTPGTQQLGGSTPRARTRRAPPRRW